MQGLVCRLKLKWKFLISPCSPPTVDLRWTASFPCGSERGCNRLPAAVEKREDGVGGIRGGEREYRFSQPLSLSNPLDLPSELTQMRQSHFYSEA